MPVFSRASCLLPQQRATMLASKRPQVDCSQTQCHKLSRTAEDSGASPHGSLGIAFSPKRYSIANPSHVGGQHDRFSTVGSSRAPGVTPHYGRRQPGQFGSTGGRTSHYRGALRFSHPCRIARPLVGPVQLSVSLCFAFQGGLQPSYPHYGQSGKSYQGEQPSARGYFLPGEANQRSACRRCRSVKRRLRSFPWSCNFSASAAAVLPWTTSPARKSVSAW